MDYFSSTKIFQGDYTVNVPDAKQCTKIRKLIKGKNFFIPVEDLSEDLNGDEHVFHFHINVDTGVISAYDSMYHTSFGNKIRKIRKQKHKMARDKICPNYKNHLNSKFPSKKAS